ncbi:MAG: YkgJ family cysteine cluster protein [Desulfobacterales bacterium]|nr:MAG: YkgJ family cysteine cluster protein [Desulfobacterales bacterium]
MFSQQDIRILLQTSSSRQQELIETYARLPKTQCRREARCCSLLPEMTLLEALAIIQSMMDMPASDRKGLIQKISGYFFINPIEITSCPFLNGQDCLIYSDRPFGCRAYGLWSPAYYKKVAEQSRQVKTDLQKQWERYGVLLPKKVCDFFMPYCLSIKIADSAWIDDKMLLKISNEIEAISEGLERWHHVFAQIYFCDFSFLAAAMMFGTTESVRMKFRLVNDIIATGEKTALDKIIRTVPDFFEE